MLNPPGSFTSTPRERLLLTVLCLLCFWSFTYHLHEVPPYHADENFYVVSVKNMVTSGDYLTPLYHDKKRFAKPLLFYWLSSISYKIFGIHMVSARLVSVMFGILCIPLTYLLVRRLFDSQTAMLSAFILPSVYLHMQISRWAITDMTLNFFILLSFYFFIKGFQEDTRRKENFTLGYFSMALGFMTKGPPALLIPAITIAMFLLLTRDRATFRQLFLLRGILIILIINAPWFAIMTWMHGDEFTSHMLGAELKDRVVHDTPFSLYFIGVLFRYYLPWSLFLVSALVAGLGLACYPSHPSKLVAETTSAKFKNIFLRVRELLDKKHHSTLFCILWIVMPLVLFTLFRIEHSRYMLPVSPAIAALLGRFFVQTDSSPDASRNRLFKIPFYLTLIIYGLLTVGAGAAVIALNPITPAPLRLMVLPVYLGFGTIFLVLSYLFRKRIISLALALAVFQIVALGSIIGDAMPFFSRYPMKSFAENILQTGTGKETVGLYQLGNNRPKLGVLTGHKVLILYHTEHLHELLATGDKVYVVMREADWRDQFSDLPLKPVSKDVIWEKTRMDKSNLLEFWEKDIRSQLSGLTEPLVLLTNR